jgi:hypothetical protein
MLRFADTRSRPFVFFWSGKKKPAPGEERGSLSMKGEDGPPTDESNCATRPAKKNIAHLIAERPFGKL